MAHERSARRKQESTRWSPRSRFRYVLDAFYAGNQSGFARALGCTQSVVSKIITGRQHPGSRLLLALASLDGMDRKWALLGEGSPPELDSGTALKLALPVWEDPTTAFDPKSPGKAAEFRAVSGADFSPTRLFLRLSKASMPLTSGLQFQVGDLLLIDRNASVWEQDRNRLDGRICFVRSSLMAPRVSLTRVLVKASVAGNAATLVAIDLPIDDGSSSPQAVEVRARSEDRRLREIHFSDAPNPRRRPAQPRAEREEPARPVPQSGELSLEQIVGVVVQLVRLF